MELPGGRGKYSAVWRHFSLEPGNKARCRTCHHVLRYFRSTYNLKRHFEAKHYSLTSARRDNDNENENENSTAIEGVERVKQEETDTEHGEAPVPKTYTTSVIWRHFVKVSPVLRRCLHCNVVLVSKSTSNMKRHMVRVHPGIHLWAPVRSTRYLPQGRRIKRSIVWKHFTKEPEGKAKCMHCDEVLSTAGAEIHLMRHLSRRHPSKAFSAEESGTESETGEQQNGNINVRPIDDLKQSDDRYYSDDAESRPATSSPREDPNDASEDVFLDLQDLNNDSTMPDPLNPATETRGLRVKVSKRTSAACDRSPPRSSYEQFEKNRMFYTANDLQDANFQATIHATNVILQLQGLDSRQRIIAEKLMSDVIYHAKLKNLTEKSMVVVHVGTFEDASTK